MFTGIVEAMGEVSKVDLSNETGARTMVITVPLGSSLLSDAQLGDSIAVNGVCLTVTELGTRWFRVGVAPETLRVTNLGKLRPTSGVNLERAVRADTQMGGHFVQGHVDATAELLQTRPDGEAVTMRFAFAASAPPDLLRHIVYKGYIALDGTSLTVTRVDDSAGWWEVMLVAYTQEKVVLAKKRAGDSVNVEVDMMAKYAEKAIGAYFSGQNGRGVPVLEEMVRRMVNEQLAEKVSRP